MKKLLVVILSVLITLQMYGQNKETKNYTAYWEGHLKVSSMSLRIVVKVFKNEDGTIGAFMDSPDQNATNIPVALFTQTDDSLKFEVPSAYGSGKYAGKIEKDSMVVVGKWTQLQMSLPLNLRKVEKLTEVKRPQTPHEPFPYKAEEVVFNNPTANIQLAGTLTLPTGEGKFPAVVMVTGSGKQDRDETIFNHKPFLVIADYLTRNGIAVLRYDDRGVAESKGNFSAATSADFAIDAISAVEFLKTRNEIDSKKIGIIGHSEGGMIAPMAAINSDDVAFIVLLAGPGLTGKDLLVLQTELILKAEGTDPEKLAKSVKQNKEAYEIVVNSPDSLTAYKRLEEMYQKDYASLTDSEKKNPENSRAVFESNVKILLSPWFRFFLKYDPKPVLEKVKIPVLALNGEKDLQVPPKEDLKGIEEALKAGGNKNFKTVELPGLNHLFQTAKTGSRSEYGKIEETFAPEALKIIGDWIRETTK